MKVLEYFPADSLQQEFNERFESAQFRAEYHKYIEAHHKNDKYPDLTKPAQVAGGRFFGQTTT